jgi:hypothetical protein
MSARDRPNNSFLHPVGFPCWWCGGKLNASFATVINPDGYNLRTHFTCQAAAIDSFRQLTASPPLFDLAPKDGD